jgi:hypothetical protein
MITQLSMPQRLAHTACELANLVRARMTARVCGNHEYLRETDLAVSELSDKLARLKAMATPADLREASEITNAPI